MSAKDVFHETVKTALIKDGWTITHDPLTLEFGKRKAYVDLGAEQPFAAERDNRKSPSKSKVFAARPICATTKAR